ncbi:ABC transporter B family member 29, chloroplastic [Hordeum vulgare]|uniref:ABC transporter B family member 29, chloroplastic n=1 Tax=Hordeum vulgare subsp. vulgare TaxID=112509 RepID=A0A8I6XE35_HORVV|nr:ABC transporter B family member 29, chloroplastic [Hordeum vulgare subsp. vulgare]KAE8774727.1 ABC transporter B family member 29, chloroplastic [Hordeum vulgare]
MAMAMANPAPPPTFSSQSRAFVPSISLRSSRAISQPRALALTATTACSIRLRVRATKDDCSAPPYPLSEVLPYVAAEWRAIAKGWACAAAAVYCLSRTVPAAGRLPRALAAGAGGGVSAEVSRGVVALAALASARAAAAYVQQALLWEAALRAVARLRGRAFERLLARDLAFFDGREGMAPGDIAHRITDEADDVADAVYSVLNTIVPTSLQLIAMGTQMVAINPQLSLVAAMVIPCMSIVIAKLGERLRQISKQAHLSLAMLAAYLNDVLPSMLTVKVNNGEHKEMLRFHELAFLDLKNNLGKKKMKALIPQAVRTTYIAGLVVLCAGSVAVSGTTFDPEGFLSFLTALALFVEPIQDFGKAYNEYKQGEPALERIFDLTRFIPEVRDKPSAVHLNSVKGDIKFHDVTFRYVAGMPPIVDGVNLHIRAGETIAIVGPSGGGKTTLAKLLLRLYHPQSGYIALDNHDIQDIQLQCLRTHIAFVSQDPMLFSGTIAENIAYGDPAGDINMRKVENAAKIANADEFIKILPEGYDSYVGQRGSSLSGGQKQRLSIARAIYQNSSILVLDEATSALDSRSELLLKEALMNLMAKHTVVIIAHRLEMILMADRIVLLEGGEVQTITRSAFLSRDGRFGSPPDVLSRELGEA